jgi:hypothetical protein
MSTAKKTTTIATATNLNVTGTVKPLHYDPKAEALPSLAHECQDLMIAYMRENNLTVDSNPANDINVYKTSITDTDGSYAEILFVGEYVAVVFKPVKDDFGWQVHISTNEIEHTLTNYCKIAFGSAKKSKLFIINDITEFAQGVFDAFTFPIGGDKLSDILDTCLHNSHAQKAVQNLLRVKLLSEQVVVDLIDANMRKLLKMLPYKEYVYVATTKVTNLGMSRHADMKKSVSFKTEAK